MLNGNFTKLMLDNIPDNLNKFKDDYDPDSSRVEIPGTSPDWDDLRYLTQSYVLLGYELDARLQQIEVACDNYRISVVPDDAVRDEPLYSRILTVDFRATNSIQLSHSFYDVLQDLSLVIYQISNKHPVPSEETADPFLYSSLGTEDDDVISLMMSRPGKINRT